MATAHKLPSGSWRVQVYAGKGPDGKKQYRSFTALSKREAEFAALEFQMHYKEVARDASNMTVAEAIDKYIASKDGVLSPATIRSYQNIRSNRIQGLMDVRLNRLTSQMIQAAINQEAKPFQDKTGCTKTPAPRTVWNTYRLLTGALSEYYPEFQPHIVLPPDRKEERTVLEPEQIAEILKKAEGTGMELPVLLAVWMCMRASEVSGLTWDCIDFQRRTVTVRQAKVRGKDGKWVLKGTKTASSTRTINAPDYILDKLEAAQSSSETEYVVPLNPDALYSRFKSFLRKNDLPDIRFHDLRHAAASVMLALNIPDKYAQQRGGWASNYTMKTIYQHTMAAKRSAVDDAIDGYFYNLIQTEPAGETLHIV